MISDRNATMGHVDKATLAEYKDPLAYMDTKTLDRLRVRYLLIALLLFSIGVVLLYILFAPNLRHHSATSIRSYQFRGGVVALLLAIGLPPYAVYRLCTIKRSIITYRRNQLKDRYSRAYIGKLRQSK